MPGLMVSLFIYLVIVSITQRSSRIIKDRLFSVASSPFELARAHSCFSAFQLFTKENKNLQRVDRQRILTKVIKSKHFTA